jgi:hypothetical protein
MIDHFSEEQRRIDIADVVFDKPLDNPDTKGW